MDYSQESLNDFVEHQLHIWPLAKKNVDGLAECQRRSFKIGDLEGAWQFNPARIKSTGAAVSKEAIANRECFLCKANRPTEQISVPIEPGWELLFNPYPIFPIHFTIASTNHTPQHEIPFEIISMAEKLKEMTVFFNGAHAGASAPDHSHMQAVLTSELPLMRLIEVNHTKEFPGIRKASELGLRLPYEVKSALITPDAHGMKDIVTMLHHGNGFVNLFCFIGNDGYLRLVRVERKAHRPDFYGNGPGEWLVSPGAIDMCGIIILPRKEDFDNITPELTARIYGQTGIEADIQHSPEV